MRMKSINIKAFRKGNKLTGDTLAEYLGVSGGFISRVEHGRDKMPDGWLQLLLESDWDVEPYLIETPDPGTTIQQTNSPGATAAAGPGAAAYAIDPTVMEALMKQLDENIKVIEALAEQLKNSAAMNEWLRGELDKRR